MNRNTIYITIGIIMIATAFVAIFSHSTSPLYCDHYDYPDSDIFQIIGKY